MPVTTKGFAAMAPEKRRHAQQRGGANAHKIGNAHTWTTAEAAAAGRRSGRVRREIHRTGRHTPTIPRAKRFCAALSGQFPRAGAATTRGTRPPERRLLTRGELANALEISPHTIFVWVERKGLPVVHSAGSRRYDVSKVLTWLTGFAEKVRRG
jgi:hypothetical protein